MKTKYLFPFLVVISCLISALISCKKLVTAALPVSSITTQAVFSDSSDANSAVLGIYTSLMNKGGTPNFCNGGSSIFLGCSADELIPYNTGNPGFNLLYLNELNNSNALPESFFWLPAYATIYQANACIEGLNASTSLTDSTRNELIAEATFLRALCYFYLINVFGDVPYVTSASGWAQTADAARTPTSNVYDSIIGDLTTRQKYLKPDYSMAEGERTRANQAAVSAFLARVYLFTKDWKDAGLQATSVINNTSYNLQSSLGNVFSPNSSEAILQWEVNSAYYPNTATAEGYSILPQSSTSNPQYFLTKQLLNDFETGDQRRTAWVESSLYAGTLYYYPGKYTIGPGNIVVGGVPPQYYMVLRLAEQYLIRAEAEANLGDLTDALGDVNTIRSRAGLSNLPSSLNQSQVLAAIMQERRIEFFAEWGHRWLDLKRTNEVDSVMAVVTPQKNGGGQWKSNQQLYPIPFSEIQSDPKLVQNPGY
jgi:hypothetical protein